MNEADTRYHLIDPVLREKGYVSRDRITLETVLTPAPAERSQGPQAHGPRPAQAPGRLRALLKGDGPVGAELMTPGTQ